MDEKLKKIIVAIYNCYVDEDIPSLGDYLDDLVILYPELAQAFEEEDEFYHEQQF